MGIGMDLEKWARFAYIFCFKYTMGEGLGTCLERKFTKENANILSEDGREEAAPGHHQETDIAINKRVLEPKVWNCR